MKKYLLFSIVVVLFLMLAVSFSPKIPVLANGQGNCIPDTTPGWIKEDTGGTQVTINADPGQVIVSVTVKAGSDQSTEEGPCTTFTENGTFACYAVSGLGTNSVTVTKVGSGPDCKDISHLEGIQETAPTPPPDVCPNIEGNQAEVPEGMIIDANGNCVTPPPPDVCPNIEGNQAEVPDGMIIDNQGNCVLPPPPPPGTASITIGQCRFVGDTSYKDGILAIDHATATIMQGATKIGDYTTSQTIQLPSGDYKLSWIADPGYTGSGEYNFTISASCKPDEPTPTPEPKEAPVTGGELPSPLFMLWQWFLSLFN